MRYARQLLTAVNYAAAITNTRSSEQRHTRTSDVNPSRFDIIKRDYQVRKNLRGDSFTDL